MILSETKRDTSLNANDDPIEQIFETNRMVLRFYGYWDDRENEFGFLHNLELCYFVEDDTIEIKEVVPPGVSRGRSFVFSSRAKLAKTFGDLPEMGYDSVFTVLDMTSTVGKDHLVLNSGTVHTEHYNDEDLAMGAWINCYGRQVVLTDCDLHTKEYYRAKYGIDDFTSTESLSSTEDEPYERPKPCDCPMTNGYDMFEDSTDNCKTPAPATHHHVDFAKCVVKDRHALDDYILRFRANLISDSMKNTTRQNDRIFIISFYLSDGTVSVFENVKPNTGYQGGMFIKRKKLYRPGQDLYTQDDFYVGSVLMLNDFAFMLMDVDEYAFDYMELNCSEFPKSDISLILRKLREALKPIAKDFVSQYMESDPCRCGAISYCQLRRALMEILGEKISEHEMIVIARYYNARCEEEKRNKEALRSIIHVSLKRFLFDKFLCLLENFHHMDPTRTCYVDRTTAFSICRALHIPIEKDILNAVLDNMNTHESGQISYVELLQFFDYKTHPTSETFAVNHEATFSSLTESPGNVIGLVNYKALLKDLDLEETGVKEKE